MEKVVFTAQAAQNVLPVSEQTLSLALRFIVILTAATVSLFLWMLIFHIISVNRFKKMERFKSAVEKSAVKAAADTTLKAADILPPVNILLGKSNISALNELFSTLPPEHKNALIALINQLDCSTFITNGLNEEDNEEYLIDLMRVVGELNLVSHADKITSIIKDNKDNIDIIFEALLALARMNSSEQFMQICMDKKYIKRISFRNLQEIIIAYTGDREILYKKLLTAPDNYIIRICIKRIGAEGIESLSPNIVKFLDSKNFNLVIDALRTIGALKYKPAAEKVQKLLKHDNWEIRNAVVQATAAIDIDQYTDSLIEALQDSEWFVRYNAGKALCEATELKEVRDKVYATNDEFAIEMLNYMMAMSGIRRVF